MFHVARYRCWTAPDFEKWFAFFCSPIGQICMIWRSWFWSHGWFVLVCGNFWWFEQFVGRSGRNRGRRRRNRGHSCLMITNLHAKAYCCSCCPPRHPSQSHPRPCRIRFRRLCILWATFDLSRNCCFELRRTSRSAGKRVICHFCRFQSAGDLI